MPGGGSAASVVEQGTGSQDSGLLAFVCDSAADSRHDFGQVVQLLGVSVCKMGKLKPTSQRWRDDGFRAACIKCFEILGFKGSLSG